MALRNVTITLDDDTAQWARVEAARHDTSVSRWIGELLEERRRSLLQYQRSGESYLTRTGSALRAHATDPLPTRDSLHDR